MVTERPPFTRWLMVPSMISSRSQALEISSHTFILSAFSLDKEIETVVALATLDEYVDLVAGLDRHRALRVDELVASDHAFTFAADIDHDRVAVNLHDDAGDDLALAAHGEALRGSLALFEQCGEIGHRSGWG